MRRRPCRPWSRKSSRIFGQSRMGRLLSSRSSHRSRKSRSWTKNKRYSFWDKSDKFRTQDKRIQYRSNRSSLGDMSGKVKGMRCSSQRQESSRRCIGYSSSRLYRCCSCWNTDGKVLRRGRILRRNCCTKYQKRNGCSYVGIFHKPLRLNGIQTRRSSSHFRSCIVHIATDTFCIDQGRCSNQ